jgi:hypothetical protein
VVGDGVIFKCKKDEAIAALVAYPTVAEAARAAKVRPQLLGRWMKDPEFDADWKAARSARLRTAIGRLQRASSAAVAALLKVMADAGAPASARVTAAEIILRHAKAAEKIENVQRRLLELKPTREVPKAETAIAPAEERTSRPMAGHGEKYSRKKDDAIAALLLYPSIEKAAEDADIGTQTLYRWIRFPDFDADWREAKRAAFGRASLRLQQAAGPAVTTLLNILMQPGVPASVRARAADLTLSHGEDAIEEDIAAQLSELGYAAEVAQAALHGDRRSFDEIARDHLKAAA